jgi:hypothetical protein
LPFYAILRAVPSKLGGVLLMVSVFVLVVCLGLKSTRSLPYFLRMTLGLALLVFWVLLFWVGGLPVVYPYDFFGKVIVFSFFFLMGLFFL